ncbi:unnamed protein product [Candidula unifasciata]|uniref:Dual specificity protein phosphatase n=1 Tax=Candidula unifasciata TaxID=100452 RepID=A0A8S3Z837_9EUPU|nr:unnamed protein product [Candidula unifasciata]
MTTLCDDDDRPCTIAELENIITAPSAGLTLYPGRAYDEVYDGIFIGEGDSAQSISCMRRLGVTHVLNAAQGTDIFHVNTSQATYTRAKLYFLGIEATDFINFDLSKHFLTAANFIEAALQAGGKVFVHCVQGVSRSATLVIAYLMIKKHMTVQEALRLVREKREICPNPGFLQQLCCLNEDLKKSGHFIPNTNPAKDCLPVISGPVVYKWQK